MVSKNRDVESAYSYDDTSCSSDDEKYNHGRKKTPTLLIVTILVFVCGIIGVSVYLIVKCTKKDDEAPQPPPGPVITPAKPVGPPGPLTTPAKPKPEDDPTGGDLFEIHMVGLGRGEINACYANSVFQCLMGIERFYKYFLEEKPQNNEIVKRFTTFVENYSKKEPSKTRPIREMMTHQEYNSDRQYEAGGFLANHLLVDIHAGFNPGRVEQDEIFPDMYPENEVMALYAEQYEKESGLNGIVQELFTGVKRVSVKRSGEFDREKYEENSVKFDRFRSFDIPIIKTDVEVDGEVYHDISSVVASLDSYFAPEMLDVGVKENKMQELPEVLIIRMQREKYNVDLGRIAKNKSPMYFDKTLEMKKEWISDTSVDYDAKPIYELISVLDHHGENIRSGHYTARVKQWQNGKWVLCNDSRVIRIQNEKEVLADPQGTATVFIYQRKRGD